MQDEAVLQENIVSALKDKPYFYDVQDRGSSGLCVVVSNPCNTYFVRKTARKFNAGFEKIASLEDYLSCFSSTHLDLKPKYAVAQDTVHSCLKKMPGLRIYRDVCLRENSIPVSTVDFACTNGEMLCLYKVALSRNHDKKKRRILASAVDFFERRFSKDYKMLLSYIAYAQDSSVTFYEKYSRRH